ncbi:sugar ABC transporter substrate-binding protein [Amphibacillus sp. MSJ-3]|uniref:ABC transporter substrate-binding protein n=1 Tax=Amphibacillus sp. MSJ-3 TaxID=2841505 RepID=UPI001C0ECABC|nr:sugar ABC transporter substrate-binding protein [Amphibacillus sp. MSJ-3]MBU5593933.1 sugar ABC transporter substrate-binding protein [Amphibacillus sp. MSJ-3]
MSKSIARLTKLISVLFFAVIVLGACSGTGDDDNVSGSNSDDTGETTEDTNSDDGGETTLTWALWDKDATVYYEPLVEAFEADHPNIKIELLDLGSTDYQTVLGTQLSGGDSSIDIVTVKDIPGYASLINRNQLEPLSELASDIDLDQYSGTVEQITVDGEYYALPFRSDFYVMYYNKDLFDAAGVDYPTNNLTFDEYDQIIREVSEKGTEATGSPVYGGHYHVWRSQVQMYGLLDGQNTLVTDDYSFLEPIYETVLAQQNDGVVQDFATLNISSLHYSAAFYQNDVASLLMGTWFIPTLATAIEEGESEDFNWGMVTMPLTEGAEEGTSTGTITTLGISSNSENKDEAWKFIEFVTSEEGSQIIADTGTMPAIQSDEIIDIIATSPGFPDDEQSKEALSVTTTYLELPLDENAAQVETILNATHDSIMTESMPVSDALEDASNQVGALLE